MLQPRVHIIPDYSGGLKKGYGYLLTLWLGTSTPISGALPCPSLSGTETYFYLLSVIKCAEAAVIVIEEKVKGNEAKGHRELFTMLMS